MRNCSGLYGLGGPNAIIGALEVEERQKNETEGYLTIEEEIRMM